MKGFEAGDIGTIPDVDYDIACRTGFHCTPLVHEVIGTIDIHGSVRFSGPFTQDKHIDHAIAADKEIAAIRQYISVSNC